MLKPSRTEGNTRLYSEEDLEQLETILTLTRDLGVNLAGVEIILNMRRKIEQMQSEVNEFMDYVKRELARGIDDWEQRLGTALVKSSPTDLVRARRRLPKPPRPTQTSRSERRITRARNAQEPTSQSRDPALIRRLGPRLSEVTSGRGCQPSCTTSKSLAVRPPNAGFSTPLFQRVSNVPLMYMSEPLSATIRP